jgi:S1-C subfamily serine protease
MPSKDSRDRTDTMGSGGMGAMMRTPDAVKIASIYGGLAFLSCVPGSPAERAGMKPGDVVVSVNGVPTPDMDAFVAARARRQDGAIVRFLRDGMEREVELRW